jgi:hypothetical protein
MTPADIIDQFRNQIVTAGTFPLDLSQVVVNIGDRLRPPYLALFNWEETPTYQTDKIVFWSGKFELHAFAKDKDESGSLLMSSLYALNLFKVFPGGMTTLIEKWGLVPDPDYQVHFAAQLSYQRNEV